VLNKLPWKQNKLRFFLKTVCNTAIVNIFWLQHLVISQKRVNLCGPMTYKHSFSRIALTRSAVIKCLKKATVCFGLMVLVCGCDRPAANSGSRTQESAVVTSVWVTPARLHMAVGQSLQFSATISDSAGNMLDRRMATATLQIEGGQSTATIGGSVGRASGILSWGSSHPLRVSVDGGGLVSALAVGTATIKATYGGQSGFAEVIVSEPQSGSLTVSPKNASLVVGESLQFTTVSGFGDMAVPTGSISWSVEPPSRAIVNTDGLLTAKATGEVKISAKIKGDVAVARLSISPDVTISGLDFPGSAGVNKTMRFEFKKPLEAYPATYIWRVYPRQQKSYYTAFFWGNNGAFYPSNTYYGFHPYPDWKTASQHFWEIASPPGGDFVNDSHVVYDRWYIQVAICRTTGSNTVQDFYWDWPNTSKVVRHTGELYPDPPMPVLAVGDAPWNHGHEAWDGVLRGFQFYATALTPDEIEQELKTPDSAQTPWYLNLNPLPEDISDKSGNGHNPEWVGNERPFSWQGAIRGGAIQALVPPR